MKWSPTPSEAGEDVVTRHAERMPQERPAVYRSDKLLSETRQVTIIDRGQRYTLRETRSGKLILYK